MKVIGVVGMNGSGKDQVVKYLHSRYGIPFLSSGDMVRELAAQKHLEPTRENLGHISAEYFQQHGKGCFMKLISRQIIQKGWQTAGISGIRSPEDVAALKSAFGKDFLLIHVYVTDSLERYSRMRQRGEGRDQNTDLEFQKQDASEEQLFHISETVKYADRNISNDGAIADLNKAIDALLHEEKLVAD